MRHATTSLFATDCYSGELRPQQLRIPANGTLLGTKIFQRENNGLDSVSAAGAKLRHAEDKVLQGQLFSSATKLEDLKDIQFDHG